MEGRRWVFARRLTSELLKLQREYAFVQVDEDEDINMGGSILEEVGRKLDAALSSKDCPDGVYLAVVVRPYLMPIQVPCWI